jgi:uncharacterized protein (DUF1778 family)
MPAAAKRKKEAKTRRLELRASERQTRVIGQAAEAIGKTVSAFVLDAAYVEAQRALADRRLFTLGAKQWQSFLKALDRPAREKPRLRRLMQTPGALD